MLCRWCYWFYFNDFQKYAWDVLDIWSNLLVLAYLSRGWLPLIMGSLEWKNGKSNIRGKRWFNIFQHDDLIDKLQLHAEYFKNNINHMLPFDFTMSQFKRSSNNSIFMRYHQKNNKQNTAQHETRIPVPGSMSQDVLSYKEVLELCASRRRFLDVGRVGVLRLVTGRFLVGFLIFGFFHILLGMIGNVIIPTNRNMFFQRGRLKPPTSIQSWYPMVFLWVSPWNPCPDKRGLGPQKIWRKHDSQSPTLSGEQM